MPNYDDPNDSVAYPLKVIQVLRHGRRVGEGVEFTGGEVLVRWVVSGERVSFADRTALSTEASGQGYEVKALTVPPDWWAPGLD